MPGDDGEEKKSCRRVTKIYWDAERRSTLTDIATTDVTVGRSSSRCLITEPFWCESFFHSVAWIQCMFPGLPITVTLTG
jgi:hypothetical protein